MPDVKFQYQFIVDENAPKKIQEYVPIIFVHEFGHHSKMLLQLNQEEVDATKIMTKDSNVKLSIIDSGEIANKAKFDIVKVQYGKEYTVVVSSHCHKQTTNECLEDILHSSKEFNAAIDKYKKHIDDYLDRVEDMTGLIDDGTVNPMRYVIARVLPQFTLCSKHKLTENSKHEIAKRMLCVQINAELSQLMLYGYKATKRSFVNKYLQTPVDDRIRVLSVDLVEHQTCNCIAIFHELEIENTHYYGGAAVHTSLNKKDITNGAMTMWCKACLDKRIKYMQNEGMKVIPIEYQAPPYN